MPSRRSPGREAVLAYLSRYTHRVAISNRRLIAFDETGVTFRYKDYRRDGADRQQVMTLAADEFIRRFLLHVLPRGFHRIRHYGLLAGSARKASLALARELLAVAPPPDDDTPEEPARRPSAVPLLRRAHDRHRDLRALAAAACAAACTSASREDPRVTRHALPPPPAAAPALAADARGSCRPSSADSPDSLSNRPARPEQRPQARHDAARPHHAARSAQPVGPLPETSRKSKSP